MLGFRRKKWDKDAILYVGRRDKIVPYITKARRVNDPKLGLYYEIKAPGKSKMVYKVGDIPTTDFSSNNIIEIYTPDFQQFVPSKLRSNEEVKNGEVKNPVISISKNQNLELIFLSNVQKEWFAKSLRDDFAKTQNKTKWDEAKTLILTVIVLAALIILAYILMHGILDTGNLMKSMLIQNYGPPIPVNSTGSPPV